MFAVYNIDCTVQKLVSWCTCLDVCCRYTVICAQFPRPSHAGISEEFPDCTRQWRWATLTEIHHRPTDTHTHTQSVKLSWHTCRAGFTCGCRRNSYQGNILCCKLWMQIYGHLLGKISHNSHLFYIWEMATFVSDWKVKMKLLGWHGQCGLQTWQCMSYLNWSYRAALSWQVLAVLMMDTVCRMLRLALVRHVWHLCASIPCRLCSVIVSKGFEVTFVCFV